MIIKRIHLFARPGTHICNRFANTVSTVLSNSAHMAIKLNVGVSRFYRRAAQVSTYHTSVMLAAGLKTIRSSLGNQFQRVNLEETPIRNIVHCEIGDYDITNLIFILLVEVPH